MNTITIYNKVYNFKIIIPINIIDINTFLKYEKFYYLGYISREDLNKIIDILKLE